METFLFLFCSFNPSSSSRMENSPSITRLREVDEEIMFAQMRELKTWVTNQTIVPELSDKTLELFLHSCFYQVASTKQTLLAYFKLRIESPFYFSDRNPCAESIRVVATTVYCFLLPGTTDEGYKVILCGHLPWNGKYQFKDNMKRFMMQIDMWLSKLDVCQGIYLVIDGQNSSLSHIKSASFDAIRKLVVYFQEALPVRMRKILFTNISSGTNMLLNMAQPILSKKICSMIEKYTTGNDGYLKYVPKRMLPRDLDGELATVAQLNEESQNELEDYREWFEEQDKIITLLAEKYATSSTSRPRRMRIFT